MSSFKIKHANIHPPAWLQKGVRNISRKLSNLMSSLKNIKTSSADLKRMSPEKSVNRPQQDNYRIKKDESSGKFNIAKMPSLITPTPGNYAQTVTLSPSINNSTVSSRQTPEVAQANRVPIVSKKLMDMLLSYKDLTDKTFFQSNRMPDPAAQLEICEAEDILFPLVLKSFNVKHNLNIKYTYNLSEISDLMLDKNWYGRQQFIYDSSEHSILVDLYKNFDGNMSVITIDTLKGTGELCTESILANHLAKKSIPQGKLALLSFKTDAQRNYIGCKYFNMHFAKTAAKDKDIMELHEASIEDTRSKAIAAFRAEKMNEFIPVRPHPHTFFSAEETPEFLNARYYKHSHSSQRLNALPEETKEQRIFKDMNVIERSNQFRVERTKIVTEKDEATEQVTEKEVTLKFSNSLDHFRRKRIADTVAFWQPYAAREPA